MNGGELIAEVLTQQGVRFLFTLCGGHISPILVGAKRAGIRVIDVRHEANAVFAADAVARLTGSPGIAAVTAGPGVTNTITAVKNAQLAQSPLVILGGATGTILKGRGALQDIDQLALFAPHVKWAASVNKVRDLAPMVEHAFHAARRGVPGPVFVECPVDLLYDEEIVRKLYGQKADSATTQSVVSRLTGWYLRRHVDKLFEGADRPRITETKSQDRRQPSTWSVRRAASMLRRAERPVLMVGSQATLESQEIEDLASAVKSLAVPTYLSGMARGLLGREHPQQLRHQRRKALREADLVLLAGVPCDFRLDYGRQIGRKAKVVAINRSREELVKNRRPSLPVQGDPALFLRALAREIVGEGKWGPWLETLRFRDKDREEEIERLSREATEFLNPLALCAAIDSTVEEDSVLVADGGDFVATASYITSPRSPLSWLDPGVYGTLGVGAGFALGAKLCRPQSEVWILYGDGSAAYSLAEFDTFVRHQLPVIAVVGNDACWAQIAREQVEILEDDVGTVLRRSDYHLVAEGYGGKGFQLDEPEEMTSILGQAQAEARNGHPVLVNAHLGRTEFRKGSISM